MSLPFHVGSIRRPVAAFVTAAALVAAAFVPSAIVGAQAVDPGQPTVAVPRAECGPGSRPENGMQGQVPAEDRDSGRSADGYQCNLEQIGGSQHGEGASWQFAWYEDCAYYGTLDTPTRTTPKGAVVVDMSDPTNPVETGVLDTPAMNDPHESLKVNEERALLAANDLNDPGFDIYDISDDCTKPELLASTEFPGTAGHEGNFTPDGLTYYTGDRTSGNNRYCPIDVSDPRNPELIMCWPNPGTTHGMSFNDDGTRGYFSLAQGGSTQAAGGSLNGLLIADTSEIQQRKPDPTIHVISTLLWSDGAQAQMTQPMTINGKPYLLFVDELGRGAGRIIDISDETNPTIVSRLKLDVHLTQNSGVDVRDAGEPLFVYDGHYCTVDDEKNSTAVACGYFESGIRVFDVRDPEAPQEIAYFYPPAITDRPLPASSHGGGTADRCAAQIRFVPHTRQLWTQCQDNELLTLQFTNGVYPLSVPARDTASACPPDRVPAAGYRDVEDDSAHAAAIDCVTWWGVAHGRSRTQFAPAAGVTRGQMASFVAGLVEASGTKLAPGRDRFVDDDGDAHEASINKLAAAGVISGRTPRRFVPSATVTRGEMATALARGYELASGEDLAAGTDYFDDDNSSVHEASINKLAAARLVSGAAPRTFAPGVSVSREQLASFLARGLAQLVDDGAAEVP